MSRNRLTNFFPAQTELPQAPLPVEQPALRMPVHGSMIAVTFLGPQPAWQAELYRRAYQQALTDLAPPRHIIWLAPQEN